LKKIHYRKVGRSLDEEGEILKKSRKKEKREGNEGPVFEPGLLTGLARGKPAT